MKILAKIERKGVDKFLRLSKVRRQRVKTLGQVLVGDTAHFGIRRSRDMTKEAIDRMAGEGHPEFEAVIEEDKWSDVGPHSLSPSYKWVTRKIKRKNRVFYQRYLRRKYPRHIKVYAEKVHRMEGGWRSAVINRTKGITELNERTHILDRLNREMADFAKTELTKLKRKI